MRYAEELYQAGAISYPRTETDMFDKQYDLRVRALGSERQRGGRTLGCCSSRDVCLVLLWDCYRSRTLGRPGQADLCACIRKAMETGKLPVQESFPPDPCRLS